MKRMALEFFGQLRFCEIQDTIDPFINTMLEKYNIKIDTFGTFWDDEYTNDCIQKGYLNNINTIQLIKEPEEKNGNLNKYFFSLQESINQRKQYEIDNNIKYDYIILSRYDNAFSTIRTLKLESLLNQKSDNFVYTSYKPLPIEFFNNVTEKKCSTYKMDDQIIICSVKAANSLSKTYEYFIQGKFSTTNLKYHSSLYESLKYFNIEILEGKFVDTNVFRHLVIKEKNINDDIWIEGVYMREYLKTIQSYTMFEQYLKRLST